MNWLKPTLLSFIFISSLTAQAVQSPDVKSFQLKNGLKVLFLEDRSIPNANMYIFWKVGSRNEAPGITGLSHFFEHMMFNGSKNYPAGAFDKVMEASGGSNNAYTSENVTVYTNWFPAEALGTVADLEADRIAFLQLDDNIIESERQVVLSERSTGLENNPWEQLSQGVRDVAFSAHPYSWPVIGWESDIRSWTKHDLQTYFETYYNPSNAVMVIVGAISPEVALSEIAPRFEGIVRSGKVPPVRTVEPPQLGERRVFVKKESATSPQLISAFHIPQSSHADYYALDLLSEIMTGGLSSRLYKVLVDQKEIAAGVHAEVSLSIDPDLFTISVEGMAGKNIADVERALFVELEKLIKSGVTSEELEKAKNKKIAAFYRHMETINGKAELLGNYEVFFGGYQKLFEAPTRYQAVTTTQIKRVLGLYFVKQNRTVGIQDRAESSDMAR